MKKMTAAMKLEKNPDGDFEGEIPINEVEDAIFELIKKSKPNSRFIFDDYIHKTEDEFLAFIAKIGVPDFILFMTAKEDSIK
jgi:hypothetical protein